MLSRTDELLSPVCITNPANPTQSKTTLFKDTINTEVEKRGKENQKGKED
jgi:hypothetical protein